MQYSNHDFNPDYEPSFKSKVHTEKDNTMYTIKRGEAKTFSMSPQNNNSPTFPPKDNTVKISIDLSITLTATSNPTSSDITLEFKEGEEIIYRSRIHKGYTEERHIRELHGRRLKACKIPPKPMDTASFHEELIIQVSLIDEHSLSIIGISVFNR